MTDTRSADYPLSTLRTTMPAVSKTIPTKLTRFTGR
jgi:hypothetical protein